MKKYWVYIHTCPNGKKYVGITTASKPERRWLKGNGYRYNDHFYRAILKYGWDNFEHEVFEVDSKEEMYRKEVELISFYHSNDPNFGYNHSVGGEHGSLGCRCSEETRKKISETKKGKVLSEEHRKKISEAVKKRFSDPEVRRKRSEARKREWLDPEIRRKKCEAQKKVHLDPEYRKKISEALKGKSNPHSEETKRKLSELHRRKTNSDEHMIKLYEAKNGKHLSEETRMKMSNAKIGKPKNEEWRRKISKALKTYWEHIKNADASFNV